MTPEQLAAMEQALEALEKTRDENVAYMDFKEPYHEAITALRTAIEQAKRQQALDKMAEDERRLGIQMQPGPAEWNKSIRDGVDSLLAQAGFEPDSSARHQLAMMNFESTTVQLKNWRVMLPGGRMTDEWESARAGDYNRGWNAYRKAAKAVLEKLEATPPAAPMQETTGQAPCAPAEDGVCEALECCKKPNAAPVQEPVLIGWDTKTDKPIYTTVSPRKPLTYVEIERLYYKCAKYQEEPMEVSGWQEFARAIEAAHGITGETK